MYCSKYLKSLSKFSYLCCLTLSNLFYNGFCVAPEEQEGKGNEKDEFVEGTGVGEGYGEVNVSKEM